jgi:cation:H+ antiporter
MTGPQITFFRIHPITILLIIAYIFGLRQISQAQTEPMWRPKRTRETLIDKTKTIKMARGKLILAWGKFIAFGAIVGFSGFVVAKSGIAISTTTGISQTIVGGLFTAIITSVPELVTSVSAVRQGALTLAVGGIIGGNSFDVLFLAFADFAYGEGSVYASLTNHLLFMISLAILLTGILLLGLLRREKHGIGNIGFESFLILVLYIMVVILLFVSN